MKRFNPSSKHPDRAVQAWQILIGAAMHRQTLTYEGLSVLMYQKEAAGVLNSVLGHVAFFCIENNLPPLTAIVVGKNSGTPGDEIPVSPATMDADRERVYTTDWYDIYPPSAEALQVAHSKHK